MNANDPHYTLRSYSNILPNATISTRTGQIAVWCGLPDINHGADD